MKFHIERGLLQEAISTVIRAVPAKSTIQSLEGLLLDADGGKLTVTAYNTRIGIRTCFDADIEQGGRAIINAKLFGDIVRKMPNDTVTLDCGDDMTAKLRCGNASYSVSTLPAVDYPELPEVEESSGLTLSEAALKSMISGTNYAVSTDETRPAQTGALFEVDDGKLNMVACDGFRLAVRTEDVTCENMEFVVPGDALSEVERLCSDSQNEVEISVGERHVMFFFGTTELISRRLDGQFLDWKKVVPKDNDIIVRVDAKDIMKSIDRVSVVISEKLKSPVRCRVGDGEITLSVQTAIGAATDKCRVYGDGGGLEIGFNNRYLCDAFRYAPDSVLNMSFKGSASAAIITAASGDNIGKYLHMVLPVRLKAN